MDTCEHDKPVEYGASQVEWADRETGVGTLVAPCEACGDTLVWRIEA